MLDMGFLPSIRQIVSALPKKRQTLMFSATLSKEIEVAHARISARAEDRADRPPRESRRDGDATGL